MSKKNYLCTNNFYTLFGIVSKTVAKIPIFPIQEARIMQPLAHKTTYSLAKSHKARGL